MPFVIRSRSSPVNRPRLVPSLTGEARCPVSPYPPLLVCIAISAWFTSAAARASGPGDEAVVLYNSRLPESKELAYYYADQRQIPTNQIFGLNLPESETISRTEFRERLQKPFFQALADQKLLVLDDRSGPSSEPLGIQAKIRYAVLCYGVPVRILKDPSLEEPGMDKIRPELRRNEAAIDSDLACLAIAARRQPLFGPAPNPVYGLTNRALLHPTNGVLMVARLDGPGASAARGLIDKAIQAETDGLWGRAYFDLRGMSNGNYKIGDDWIRHAASISKRVGFETTIDEKPETFPASLPLSHLALYAGWYDSQISGPFAREHVEFMPGAVAYHLHSFSAHHIRTPDQYWVGPLIAKGATATIGSVDEPYLEFTPDIGLFYASFIYLGYTLGEAAYACQNALSWQTTIVGDPLYRPFGKNAPELHEQLIERKSKMVEWSVLRAINQSIILGEPETKFREYLARDPMAQRSSILKEKLAELYYSSGKLADAIYTYEQLLKLELSPQQRIRVMLAHARILSLYQRKADAYVIYQQFIKEFPNYPDLLSIHQKSLELSQVLGKTAEIEEHQKAISRLSTPPPSPSKP